MRGFGGETRDHVEYIVIRETIRMLTLKNRTRKCGLGSYGSGTVVRYYERGSESIRFIKCSEFFDHLRNCWLPKKDCFMEFV
jgi:hypothetical protein